MSLKGLLCGLIGFCAGTGVAAGTFAFLLVIRVIPRMIQKAKLQHKIILIENTVAAGVLFGTILSLFAWKKQLFSSALGQILLILFGLSAGNFVGCTAVALAEILDTFPIFFRRLKLKQGLCQELVTAMALGKLIGSLFYFLMGYGMISS